MAAAPRLAACVARFSYQIRTARSAVTHRARKHLQHQRRCLQMEEFEQHAGLNGNPIELHLNMNDRFTRRAHTTLRERHSHLDVLGNDLTHCSGAVSFLSLLLQEALLFKVGHGCRCSVEGCGQLLTQLQGLHGRTHVLRRNFTRAIV